MSNSSLVNYTKLSPNNSGRRTHAIDRITPHCVVGQASAEDIASYFPKPVYNSKGKLISGRKASCNYGIGKDGRVALIVEEEKCSWCSTSSANDQRAVTIECASDKTSPYAFNDAVYNKLVDLCVDICRRNGKTKLLWLGDKGTTLAYAPKTDEMVLTVHRWFADKACPGDWLMARMGSLASTVTSRLGGSVSAQPEAPAQPRSAPAASTEYVYEVTVSNLRIRKTPGGALTGQYTGKGTFTIAAESNGWGKLKSGAGWISLDPRYGHKVSGGSAPQAPALGLRQEARNWTQLTTDGILGEYTIKRSQEFFSTPQDGIISRPSIMIKALQKWLGGSISIDGYLGPKTIRRWQTIMGTPVDGVISKPSTLIRAWQSYLNHHYKA